jgi:hypothetical protein
MPQTPLERLTEYTQINANRGRFGVLQMRRLEVSIRARITAATLMFAARSTARLPSLAISRETARTCREAAIGQAVGSGCACTAPDGVRPAARLEPLRWFAAT